MHRIKLTNKEIQEIISDVRRQLKTSVATTGTIDIKYNLNTSSKAKATLVITEEAYKKYTALVDCCPTEVAWHGIMTRNKNVFTLKDILVFPQVVTSSTVDTDDTAYAQWLDTLDDETFRSLRFHGHSHVRMGTAPSGTDASYQQALTATINDFYVFMITNKLGSNWIKICDVENNIVYDTKDIILELPVNEMETWAEEMIDKHVVKETKTQAVYKHASQYERNNAYSYHDYYAGYMD